jgi:predicted ATPase
LRRADVRLVTLTGPGGTGKTRLAFQVAAELLDDFPDGVWFVNLAPYSDPRLVAIALAQTLGVKETGRRPLIEDLQAALREKYLLLLLDNFEQVLDAAPLVSDLLAAAPHVTILVTSRAVLHLRGEHEFAVPPLALPDVTQLPPLELLTQYAAVALFIQRAQAAQADFAVTNATAPAVAEICHRLDGLPLAIELAAARIKLFAPEALLKRLERCLPLLTGGPRDLPARQQTLRQTLDWSYQLLNAGEQKLFRRLAVFVGGCTLDAAEAVCNGDRNLPFVVVDGIASLLDKSLLRTVDGPDGEARFTMLETSREYALERLEVSGEAETVRQRHAAYFLALAERADMVLEMVLELEGPHLIEWIEPLAADYLNLRAALVFTLGVPELPIGGDAEISITGGRSPPAPPCVPPALHVSLVETGVRLAAALGSFWWTRSMYREGRAWLRRALRQPDAPAAALARATFHAGVLAHLQDDNDEAEALFAECRDRFCALGDRVGESFTCIWQGIVARKHLQAERAHVLALEALASFEALSHRYGEARARFLLGLVALDQGDFALAERDIGMAVALQDAHSTSGSAGWFHLNLGHAARFRGDKVGAMTHYRECLRIFELAHDLSGLALTRLCLHHMARARGEWSVAWEGYLACFAQFREQGNRRQAAECLEGLAALLQVAGRPEIAARLLGAAERTRELIAIPLTAGERQDYAHTLAAIRSQRDEATFAAAWAVGRAMTLEQAIEEALGAGD